MKTVLKIGLDALPNAELARFTALFPVAETRTQVAWVRVKAADADVVVCHRQPWRGSRAVSLCIDPLPLPAHEAGTGLVPLERRFRVLTLMAALDRAALRALETRGRQPPGSSRPRGLRHWVVQGTDRLRARCVRVKAAIGRRAVSRDWMASGGSLSFNEIDDLLSELREHGSWRTRQDDPLIWQPGKPAAAASLRRPGWLSRLRRWLKRQRAAGDACEPDPQRG